MSLTYAQVSAALQEQGMREVQAWLEAQGYGYHGWENYATWLLYLHLTDHPSTHYQARDALRRARRWRLVPHEALRTWVAHRLERQVNQEQAEGRLAVQLLLHVLAQVDWKSLASALDEG